MVVAGQPITLTATRLFVTGDLENLDIAGLVSGRAHFEVTKDLVDADVDGTAGFGLGGVGTLGPADAEACALHRSAAARLASHCSRD